MKARIRNSEIYREAWKVFEDCVRKWEETDLEKYPAGWRYGIPDPSMPDGYLFSNCPGNLFMEFKDRFYQNDEVVKFRNFLVWLEMTEGKITNREYKRMIVSRS